MDNKRAGSRERHDRGRLAPGDPLALSVVVSTYNAEAWLEKVLLGYLLQSYGHFELIIADDGSGPATARLVSAFAAYAPFPVRHLWHEDRGYRRQEILNRAILEARHGYILFSDGDCVPRNDFLEVHAAHATPGHFLSGGYCKIGIEPSRRIGPDEIEDGSCFDLRWLSRHERMSLSNRLKLGSGPVFARFLDAVTTAKATFNNCNVSAWRDDLLAVNGYDERMKYGGADREIGERLANRGIQGLQVRHRAVCLHLHHERPYRTGESLAYNRAIREETRRKGRTWTPWGLVRERDCREPGGEQCPILHGNREAGVAGTMPSTRELIE